MIQKPRIIQPNRPYVCQHALDDSNLFFTSGQRLSNNSYGKSCMVVASPSDVSEVEGGRFATKIECHDARSEGLSREGSLGGFFLCRMKCEISPLEVQNRQGGFFFLFFRIFGKDACGVVFFFPVVSERGGVDCQWVFACKVWIWFKHQNLVFFGVEHHIIYR